MALFIMQMRSCDGEYKKSAHIHSPLSMGSVAEAISRPVARGWAKPLVQALVYAQPVIEKCLLRYLLKPVQSWIGPQP